MYFIDYFLQNGNQNEKNEHGERIFVPFPVLHLKCQSANTLQPGLFYSI